MNHQPWREFRKRWIGCVCYAIFCFIAPSAFAQIADDVEPDAPAEAVVQNNFMFADQNFDQWVFNNGTNSAQAKTKAETVLKLQIEDIDRICSLTELQKKKLRLAGQGDLKRFYDLVEEKRRKFKAVQNDQQKFNEIWQDIQPLQAKIAAGFFGQDSFFQHTVRNVLNPEQVSKYEVAYQDRRAYHFHARLELALSLLDGMIGFRDDQREKFLKLLQDDIPVPNVTNQNYYYYVIYCIAQISDEKVKPIFDELQWRALSSQFDQAKGLKDYLKQSGYELPEPKAPPKPLHRMPPRRANRAR